MTAILLVRPGVSEFCEQGRIQGTLDVPLSERGRTEIDDLVRQLAGRQIDTIYAPDCEPALESAQALARALGVRFKKLKHMENLDLGLWQGLLVDEVRQKQPTVFRQWQEQPQSIRPPKGETLDEARVRADACLARLYKSHKDGTIVLVLPEPLASVVRQQAGGALGDLWQAMGRHASVETLGHAPAVPVAART